MTDEQHHDKFDWATELSDAQGHVTLSKQEAKEIGARLRSMGAKLKTYEDLGGAADDMQLLRMGYAAARLEIESLRAAQPAGAPQPGAAYAAQDSEHQMAIMQGERNASLDAYSRVVYLTGAESRLYEAGFTNGWDRRDRLASYGQAPAQAAPAAVAGPSETVKFTDQSTADPVEKARRYLTAMGDQRRNSAYFYDDGYPRRESAQDALATLAVLEQLAAAPTTQRATQQEAPADELEEVLRERDDAEDFINELLDGVLGADRPEWSSAYNRYDAMNDVRERITALHKPAVDKAWGRFELAMAAPQPSPAAQGDALDAARLDWLLRDIGVVWSEHGDARRAIDAERAAQEGK